MHDKVSDEPQSSSVTGKDEAQEKTENAWHVVTRKRKTRTKHSAKIQDSGSTKKSQGHLKPQRATSYAKQKFEAGKNKTPASGGSSSLQEKNVDVKNNRRHDVSNVQQMNRKNTKEKKEHVRVKEANYKEKNCSTDALNAHAVGDSKYLKVYGSAT